jgi:hypothetical protein
MRNDPDSSDDGEGRASRRAFLRGVGALGVVGLAGCGGDGDGNTTTPTDTATPTDSATGTGTATDTTTTTPPGTTAASATPTDAGTPTDTATPPTVPPEERPPSMTPAGTVGSPPGDATVLFGEGVDDLSKWEASGGGEAGWTVADDGSYFEIDPGAGGIRTADDIGDCHLHIEFKPPEDPAGTGQSWGNSGVFLMGRYEIQVLNNYENDTYNDGMAGAHYGQAPPMVDPARPPTEWQSFDFIWRGPNFEDGEVVDPARTITFFNGVLVHAHLNLTGSTANPPNPYSPHEEALPMSLQDHGYLVRFRNVWYRSLPPESGVETGTNDQYRTGYDAEYRDTYDDDPVYTLEPRGGRYEDGGSVETVTPGESWGDPPSHATTLLGKDGSLEGWESADGGSPDWREGDGYVAVEPGAGNIQSTETFGDCRLHAEFRIPEDVSGVGANRGDSAVLLGNRYGISILDNHENVSEPTEWVGAYTGQAPPMASPTLPPGEWQSLDVLWEGPRFADDGSMLDRPGRLSALLNGVVVQKRLYLNGPNADGSVSTYGNHDPEQPLGLQENGDPVQFRNVWYTTVE